MASLSCIGQIQPGKKICKTVSVNTGLKEERLNATKSLVATSQPQSQSSAKLQCLTGVCHIGCTSCMVSDNLETMKPCKRNLLAGNLVVM